MYFKIPFFFDKDKVVYILINRTLKSETGKAPHSHIYTVENINIHNMCDYKYLLLVSDQSLATKLLL